MPLYIRILSSEAFWLFDERGMFYQFLFFSSFSTIAVVFA
jgi:hypothetical protein